MCKLKAFGYRCKPHLPPLDSGVSSSSTQPCVKMGIWAVTNIPLQCWKEIRALYFVEHLSCCKHLSKCFIYIFSFTVCNNHMCSYYYCYHPHFTELKYEVQREVLAQGHAVKWLYCATVIYIYIFCHLPTQYLKLRKCLRGILWTLNDVMVKLTC